MEEQTPEHRQLEQRYKALDPDPVMPRAAAFICGSLRSDSDRWYLVILTSPGYRICQQACTNRGMPAYQIALQCMDNTELSLYNSYRPSWLASLQRGSLCFRYAFRMNSASSLVTLAPLSTRLGDIAELVTQKERTNDEMSHL